MIELGSGQLAALALVSAGLAVAGGGILAWRARRGAWVVRGLLAGLALAALGRPAWVHRGGEPVVAVAVDASASIDPQWRRDVLRRVGDWADARGVQVEIANFPDTPATDRGDPADGSRPADALWRLTDATPADAPLLLMTDGAWTDAPADWPAGRRLWALCPPEPVADVGLAGLDVARAGDGAALVRATVSSTRAGQATVAITAPAGVPPRTIALGANESASVTFTLPADDAVIRARVSADWDTLGGNNELATLAPAPAGRRTGVLIAGDAQTAAAVRAVAGWRWAEPSPDALRGVDPPGAAVLADVSAEGLTPAFQAALGDYLRGGGALLVVGGPRAFASGQYFDAPIEKLLPVRSRPTNRPPAAIAIVLDASGSMNQPPAGGDAALNKIDLVTQAVLALPDLLIDADRLAVIAFNVDARTVHATPPEGPLDWRAVRSDLRGLSAGGGTAIAPAIRAAADWLGKSPLPRRHLLLLTDGQFDDMTVDQAADALSAARPATQPDAGGLTVSTFAASEQTESAFLRSLADRFGGTFYPPGDWGRLRDRFRNDLAGATAPAELPGPLAVTPVGDRPALPPVGRANAVELRDQARPLYVAGDGRHPVVAVGPVGAGRAGIVATSPAWSPRWADRFTPLLAELLDELAGTGDDPRFSLQTQSAGDGIVLLVSAREPGDPPRPMNLLDLTAHLAGEGGEAETVAFRQTAPGLYRAEVSPDAPRRLAVALGDGRVVLRRPLTPPLPAEFAHLAPRPGELDALARSHGGRLLGSLADLDAIAPPRSETRTPIWPWLLLAAAVLFLLDAWLSRNRD